MGFLSNLKEGYGYAKEMYSLAADDFSSGNILGGVYDAAIGTLSGAGNTITLGGANAIGTAIADDVESGDTNAIENVVDRVAKSQAESEILQEQLADQGNIGKANLLGGIDTASLALDIAGGVGVSKAVGGLAKTTAKTVAKDTAKQTAKAAIKDTTGDIAEYSVKEATKDTIAKTAEQTIKSTAKDTAKDAAEQVVKNEVKDAAASTAKTVTKDTIGTAVKDTAKKETQTSIKKAFTKAAASTVAEASILQIDGNNVNQIIEDTKKDGIGSAITKAAIKQGTNIAGDAANVADDVTSAVTNSWLSNHPGLAKFVNSVRAAGYASRKMIERTATGSYASATISKITTSVHDWASSTSSLTSQQTLSDVAKDIQSESEEKSNGGWSKTYLARVTTLDAELGVDTTERWTYQQLNKNNELA